MRTTVPWRAVRNTRRIHLCGHPFLRVRSMRRLFSNAYTGRTMILSATLAVVAALSQPTAKGQQVGQQPISYRTVQVDGLSIFYRDAGPKDAPTIVLLHGFPSSSRM